jgi:MFS family permease
VSSPISGTILAKLTDESSYMDGMSSTIKSRLSNSYLIGEIFGMLFFGVLIDRIGRRTGIIAATAFLILGVVLATASHGKSQLGYLVQYTSAILIETHY